MKDIMNWKECEEKFIRKVEIDNKRIESLLEKTDLRLKRARNTKLDEKTVSLIVEDYYEIIKELLVAFLLKNGLRSSNHQCLISYFYRKNPNHEKQALLISQMSFFRNRLDYYGESIPLEFYNKNKEEFEKIIRIIKNLLNRQT